MQGEQLSCVIIDKLPFAVPNDPVVAARVKAIDEDGGNAFFDYQVPSAVISFKQGFGRLIRSLHDRGLAVPARQSHSEEAVRARISRQPAEVQPDDGCEGGGKVLWGGRLNRVSPRKGLSFLIASFPPLPRWAN